MATFEKRIGKGGKATWRVRVRRQNGPWLTKSFSKKVDGEQWARTIEHKLDAGEHVPAAEARKRTLADAIDKYTKDVLPRARRAKDASKRLALLKRWNEQLGMRSLVSLSSAVIAEARDELARKESRLGGQISGSTINRHLAALSAVLKVAMREWGWISKNPVSGVTKFEESRGRERFLDDAERERLLEACAQSECAELLPIVQLALATGARRGELTALDWSRVDLDKRRVTFNDTKNTDTRTVPLAAPAVAALRSWRKDRVRAGRVFPAPVHVVEKAWQAARTAAGLEDVRFHDLRHTAASYLAMSGASLLDIASILGHRTLAMVRRYSHLSEQHTTAAVDRMAAKFLSKESG